MLISCDNSKNLENLSSYSNIDLVISIYNKPNLAFKIDPSGGILELKEGNNNTEIYQYKLDADELDSLNKYVNNVFKFNKSTDGRNDCSHGIFYSLTILTKDKNLEYKDIVCDEKTSVDKLVFYVLFVSENKLKELIFKNYLDYKDFLNNVPK